MPVNRIITRGMGASRGKAGVAGLVTQGYGGFFRIVKDGLRKAARLGQSGAKRAIKELEEVFIAVKLVRVNDEKPKDPIQGSITVKVDLSRKIAVVAEGISKRIRSAWEDIKITVKRIR
jgi:hypothetical protein